MSLKSKFRNRRQALFYKKNIDGSLECSLCPNSCFLTDGETGVCRVRGNRGGVLYSLNYGWIRALNMEQIESVPLMEYYNGMNVLAIGSWGCNMRCPVCADRQLIAEVGSGRALYPNELAEIAAKLVKKDNIGIAYSFGESAVNYEYVLESCRESKRYGLHNLFSTNGYLNPKPLKYLLPHLDAVNLDIKSMDMDYYENAGGMLAAVLQNAKIIAESGVHLEISRVLVPGLNDSKEEISALAMFIRHELGKNVPLHLLEYVPNGRSSYSPTPESDLHRAADWADKYLNSVYIGTP